MLENKGVFNAVSYRLIYHKGTSDIASEMWILSESGTLQQSYVNTNDSKAKVMFYKRLDLIISIRGSEVPL